MKPLSLILLLVCGFSACASEQHCKKQLTTPISVIQGEQQNSSFVNQKTWVKGIVTGDFRGDDNLGGYFVQSLKPDAKKTTSEGIFVKENNRQLPFKVGDVIITHGEVVEKFGVTQLKNSQRTKVCERKQVLPEAVTIELPLENADLEYLEGMRVTLGKPKYITNNRQYFTYGELTVSSSLLMNPTSVVRPGVKAQKLVAANRLDQLIIDDGSTRKYPFFDKPNGFIDSEINADNPIKIGQKLATTGVMYYAFGQYKLQPTEPIKISHSLPGSQTKPKDVRGDLTIATFNVENFFTSVDEGKENCGPLVNFFCRGADNKTEYQRQLAKLVHVINTADAAVMGLQELENNAQKSIRALVDALNKDAGREKWGYIDTGALGEDVIKVGLIYQVDLLKPQGQFALLNRASDPEFLEHRNRIIVAQTFTDTENNSFNVATVHFKSKSCRDAMDKNLDQNDGQGCYNPIRTQVAAQLSRWLAEDPTGQGAAATFIVGDFNSYQLEDPMVKLKQLGYKNLANTFLAPQNWTSSFRGTVGSLDYVLANAAGQTLVTGLTQWHINSVSMDEFGYNNEPFNKNIEKPKDFYQLDPYSSSDHDVVIAGIAFKK